MQISAAPLIYILIFVAVLMLVEGLYLTVFGKSISLNSRLSRRLALLEKVQDREKVLEQFVFRFTFSRLDHQRSCNRP